MKIKLVLIFQLLILSSRSDKSEEYLSEEQDNDYEKEEGESDEDDDEENLTMPSFSNINLDELDLDAQEVQKFEQKLNSPLDLDKDIDADEVLSKP